MIIFAALHESGCGTSRHSPHRKKFWSLLGVQRTSKRARLDQLGRK